MSAEPLKRNGPTAKERLAISELQLAETLSWALEVCPVGNICFTIEGVIVRASAELHRLTGRPSGWLDGRELSDLFSPELLAEDPSILDLAFRDRASRETVYIHRIRSSTRVVRIDGTEEPVSILVIELPAGRADELAFAYILPDEGIPDGG